MKSITNRDDLLGVLESTLIEYAESEGQFSDNDRTTLAESVLIGILDAETHKRILDLPGLYGFVEDNLPLIGARFGEEAAGAFNLLLQELDDATSQHLQEMRNLILESINADSGTVRVSGPSGNIASREARTLPVGTFKTSCSGSLASFIRQIICRLFPDFEDDVPEVIDRVSRLLQDQGSEAALDPSSIGLGFAGSSELTDESEFIIAAFLQAFPEGIVGSVEEVQAAIDAKLALFRTSMTLRDAVRTTIGLILVLEEDNT